MIYSNFSVTGAVIGGGFEPSSLALSIALFLIGVTLIYISRRSSSKDVKSKGASSLLVPEKKVEGPKEQLVAVVVPAEKLSEVAASAPVVAVAQVTKGESVTITTTEK